MRDQVFKVLFQNEFRTGEIEEILNEFLGKESSDSMKSDIRRYVLNIYEKKDLIDEKITSCLENWELDRVSLVDKCLLRLGTYELVYEPDIPVEVTLDEIIELAKRYGTENSGKFVNGVLDKVAKTYVPAEKFKL